MKNNKLQFTEFKFASIILIIMFCISMFSISVSAAGGGGEQPTSYYYNLKTTYTKQSVIIQTTNSLDDYLITFVNTDYMLDTKTYKISTNYIYGTPNIDNTEYYIWNEDQDLFFKLDGFGNNLENYNRGYDDGIIEGIIEGYEDGYIVGVADTKIALTDMQVIIISVVLFIIGLVIAFIFKIRWLYAGISILCFIPIIIVDNLYIKLFSVILMIVMIILAFFNTERSDW